MKKRLLYIELKSGFSGYGPAWIDLAGSSKTGATIYSNGKALKRLGGAGISGNHFDVESRDEYWVSGVKKNDQDRHRTGGGDILINRNAIEAYLAATGQSVLPKNIRPADLKPSQPSQVHLDLEHRSVADD